MVLSRLLGWEFQCTVYFFFFPLLYFFPCTSDLINRVRRQINHDQIRERICEDVERNRYSHAEWQRASASIRDDLTKKKKEPEKLLFFRGAVFECTYNEPRKFNQSQLALLHKLPDTEDLDNFRKIEVLIAPPGLKEIHYDVETSEETYVNRGFRKIKIGTAPERACQVRKNIQGIRIQYGLRHFVSGTLHSLMGDTLTKMATEISAHNSNFNLWEKGQLVVLLSRTRYAKDTIFVGSKADTLSALRELVQKKTQWTDYIENILSTITINTRSQIEDRQETFTQEHFPFRIKDAQLPQCNSGFVYMLISLRQMDYIYIGETKNVITRLKQHNQGIGSSSTAPEHLRPWAIVGYVCGFQGHRDLRLSIEQRWKIERDRIQRNGCHDVRTILHSVHHVINTIDQERFDNVEKDDLILVSLLQSDRE